MSLAIGEVAFSLRLINILMIKAKPGLKCYLPRNFHLVSQFGTDFIRLNHTSLEVIQDENARQKARKVRLSEVTDILQREVSYQRTSLKINKIYGISLAQVFEDLKASTSQNRYIALGLCRGFKQSRSMRGLFLDQLHRCILSQDYHAFATGVKIMEESGLLNNYERITAIDLDSLIHDQHEIHNQKKMTTGPRDLAVESFNFLILLSITAGEPLIGVLCCLQARDQSIDVKTDTLERLMSALSIYDPLLSNYHSFALFKIVNAFPREFSPKVIIEAVRSMALGHNPYFANVLYDQYCHNMEQSSGLKSIIVETRHALLSANLRYGNSYRSARLWRLNCESVTEYCEKNISVFKSIMESVSNEAMKESLIVKHFPESLYADPNIVDFSLAYFGQRAKFRPQFEAVIDCLKPPLSRNTLSLLFASFISQNREEAAEKVLRVIFETKSGLNSEDFLVIVQKLLRKRQINQCVDMCMLSDFKVSYKGFMRVTEFLLAHSTSEEEDCTDYSTLKDTLLQDLITKLHEGATDVSVKRLLTVTLFKHFSTNVNNRASRKLFLSLTSAISDSGNEFVNLESYNVPPEIGKFLIIDDGDRLQCLEVILLQAKSENDSVLIDWCAKELQLAGVPVADIESHYLVPK